MLSEKHISKFLRYANYDLSDLANRVQCLSNALVMRYQIQRAKREIQNFVNKHPWSLTSEIIEQLRIEPPLAIKVLKELKKEGLAVSKPVV